MKILHYQCHYKESGANKLNIDRKYTIQKEKAKINRKQMDRQTEKCSQREEYWKNYIFFNIYYQNSNETSKA